MSNLELLGLYCLSIFPLYLLFRFLHFHEARHHPDSFDSNVSFMSKLHIVFIFLAFPIAFPIEMMDSYHAVTQHDQGLLRYRDEKEETQHQDIYMKGFQAGFKAGFKKVSNKEATD